MKVDVGELRVVGPSPVFLQHRTCVAGQTCEIRDLLGTHLSWEDQWIALDTCGAADHTIPRFSFTGHAAGDPFQAGFTGDVQTLPRSAFVAETFPLPQTSLPAPSPPFSPSSAWL